MVEFINRDLGTHMMVADNRVDFYKAMGHIPVADLAEKAVKEEPKKVEEPKKAVATKKKR